VSRKAFEASSNGRTADFGSAYEGSNPSASAKPPDDHNHNHAEEVRPRPLPIRLIAVELGDLPAHLLGEVAGGVAAALGGGWRPGPPLDRPAYAFNEARRQFHAPAVLRRLAGLRDRPGSVVLGLVRGDLFLPDDGDYVRGDADREAGAGLVGLARLGADPAVVRRRAQVEALRVMGSVLGLSACPDARCAMYPARDVAEVDRKAPALCAHCRAALGLP
jgi:archaemetzincin